MVLSNMVVRIPRNSKAKIKPRWTIQEITILERFYGNIPNQQIADKLHRPLKGVECKAAELGLTKTHERRRQVGTDAVMTRWYGRR